MFKTCHETYILTDLPRKCREKLFRTFFVIQVRACRARTVSAWYNTYVSFNLYRARSVFCLHELSQILSYCSVRSVQLDCRSARRTQNINLPTNQKSYNNSETTVGKLSARRIQICQVHFSVIIFDLLFFKTSKKWPQQKLTQQI